MKKLLVILLCFPFFSTASFPILSSLQINDTIINSKTPAKTQVDSLSIYPIGNESLAEYKERLKKWFKSDKIKTNKLEKNYHNNFGFLNYSFFDYNV